MTKQKPPRPFKQSKRDAGRFIESILSSYDPDADFKIKNVANPVLRFMAAVAGEKKPDLVERARLIEVNRFGAFRVREVKSSDEFRAALKEAEANKAALSKIIEAGVAFRPADKFTEADRAEAGKLTESAKFREDFGFDGTGNPFDEFIPISGGPWNHQQYLHDFLDGLAKSFEAWNHSPYAHQIIRITTCFTLGRGVTCKAKDTEVGDAFMEWWRSLDMDGRLETWSDMLGRDGELMVRRFKNPLTKRLFLRWVDPSTVWEVVTDIEDTERIYYYHQQYPAAYQVLYGAPAGAKFNPDKFESSKYIINQIPADEVYHVKINVSPNEKRGRSDIFVILGWLKRHKDFQTGTVLKAIIQSVFAWKNKLKGTQTDVDAFIQAYGTDVPEFGSLWTENEASELTPMTADKVSAQGVAEAPGIVTTISVGPGIPQEYLGAAAHSTRSSAVVATEPGVKKFQARQLLLGRFLKRIAKDWFDNEVAEGRIPRMKPGDDPDLATVLRWLQKAMRTMPAIAPAIDLVVRAISGKTLMSPTDGEIDFMFPEIAVEDRTAKMADLETALVNKVISHEQYAAAVAKELGFHDYDYDDAQDKIAEEASSGMAPLYAGIGANGTAPAAEQPPKKSGGLSGEERAAVKTNDGH